MKEAEGAYQEALDIYRHVATEGFYVLDLIDFTHFYFLVNATDDTYRQLAKAYSATYPRDGVP